MNVTARKCNALLRNIKVSAENAIYTLTQSYKRSKLLPKELTEKHLEKWFSCFDILTLKRKKGEYLIYPMLREYIKYDHMNDQ